MSFAEPWWLALGVLPWLALRAVGAGPVGRRPLLRHPFADRLGVAQRSVAPRRSGSLAAALGFSLLAVALARPQTVGDWLAPPVASRQIVMVVDSSQSMSIRDYRLGDAPASRMQVLRATLARFVGARRGDEFALVNFATRAATFLPMTHDADVALSMIERLRAGLGGDDTAIGDGIGLALREITGADGPRPALLVFSDGRQKAARLAPALEHSHARDLFRQVVALAAHALRDAAGHGPARDLARSLDADRRDRRPARAH